MLTRPSTLQQVARCELRWLLGGELSPTPAMRFGTAVHALLEAYYQGVDDPPRVAAERLGDNPCVASMIGAGWRSPVGRCATAGMAYLPRPDRCELIATEAPAIIPGAIAGTRDLYAVVTSAEQERLNIPTRELVLDYKTSSNPERWAVPAAILRNDPQGVVYPYSAILDYDLERVTCRWVYLPSLPPHIGATYTQFIQSRARLEKVQVPQIQDRAKRCLRIVQDPSLATINPTACNSYGRLCPHHQHAGGICPGNQEEYISMAESMADRIARLRAERAQQGDAAPAPKPTPTPKPKAKAKAKPKAEPAPEPETESVTGRLRSISTVGDVWTVTLDVTQAEVYRLLGVSALDS